MFDMQALALQSDLTRVSTLMMGREGSLRTYPEIGVPDPHHPLTHHRDNPEWIEKVTKVNVFHMEQFARFVGKLAAMPEGDGTVLDHTVIVYGSGIADGNKHTHENLPVLLVGGGAGLKGDRHLVYDDNTPMTNFYLTLLDRVGVREDQIGDSTGRVEHLTRRVAQGRFMRARSRCRAVPWARLSRAESAGLARPEAVPYGSYSGASPRRHFHRRLVTELRPRRRHVVLRQHVRALPRRQLRSVLQIRQEVPGDLREVRFVADAVARRDRDVNPAVLHFSSDAVEGRPERLQPRVHGSEQRRRV